MGECVRSFAPSFARSFVCSFVRSFLSSFVRSQPSTLLHGTIAESCNNSILSNSQLFYVAAQRGFHFPLSTFHFPLALLHTTSLCLSRTAYCSSSHTAHHSPHTAQYTAMQPSLLRPPRPITSRTQTNACAGSPACARPSLGSSTKTGHPVSSSYHTVAHCTDRGGRY